MQMIITSLRAVRVAGVRWIRAYVIRPKVKRFHTIKPYLFAIAVNLCLCFGLSTRPVIVNRTVTTVVMIVTAAVTSRIISVWYMRHTSRQDN